MITDAQRSSANLFMTALCVWREAREESYEGKLAVAFTVVNRAKHPKWWGNSPYAVVVYPLQYSSITYPKDLQLCKYPKLEDPSFADCMTAAEAAINNSVENPAPGADSYFADYITTPKWANPRNFVKKIGHHCFYNLDGDKEGPKE